MNNESPPLRPLHQLWAALHCQGERVGRPLLLEADLHGQLHVTDEQRAREVPDGIVAGRHGELPALRLLSLSLLFHLALLNFEPTLSFMFEVSKDY